MSEVPVKAPLSWIEKNETIYKGIESGTRACLALEGGSMYRGTSLIIKKTPPRTVP